MRVFASRNAENVMERARSFYPSSMEVSPVGLRDIFLETIKEN
jgi:ABC-2 type transport system ATP-binding protein